MRDALGGTVVLTIIVVFIVFVSAYLAFNVNYMKAFNMKNKIIEYYNEYDGKCNNTCQTDIAEYAKKIGYDPPKSMSCPSGYYEDKNSIFCYKKSNAYVSSSSTKSGKIVKIDDIKPKYYYTILTTIDIKIPIVQNTLGYRFLSVSGDTKLFS